MTSHRTTTAATVPAWWRTACLLPACLLPACLGLAGCGHGPPVQRYQVVIPDEITTDGSQWQKQPWSAKDDQRLEAYFRRHASLADNPGFHGEKVSYAHASGKQRYYWVNPVDETCHWILLEFQGTKATNVVEGQGEPFVELVRKQ